jgi:hypothetical protein
LKSPKDRKPIFERLKTGPEEGIRHAKGEIARKTTTLEMPGRPPEVDGKELTKLRLKNGMSQAVFAQVLKRLDEDGSKLGTGPAQAVAGGVEINPGVSSKPVRSARVGGDVCEEPRITSVTTIRHWEKESQVVFGSEGTRAMMSAAISNSEDS